MSILPDKSNQLCPPRISYAPPTPLNGPNNIEYNLSYYSDHGKENNTP